jgi:hypothetical protein
VVVSLLAFPAISAWTASDLERMATKDVIPEIRLAAGYALVNYSSEARKMLVPS